MIDLNLGSQILFFGKMFFVFAFVVYAIFAAVVVRQVYLMTDSLEVGFERPVRIIAWAHFGLAIAVLLFVLLVL